MVLWWFHVYFLFYELLVCMKSKCQMIFKAVSGQLSHWVCVCVCVMLVTKWERHWRWRVDECVEIGDDKQWLVTIISPRAHSVHMQRHKYTLKGHIILLMCILSPPAAHHAARSSHIGPRPPGQPTFLWLKMAFIRAPTSCRMWPCDHVSWSITRRARRRGTPGTPWAHLLSAWSGGRACSVKMTLPYGQTLIFFW